MEVLFFLLLAVFEVLGVEKGDVRIVIANRDFPDSCYDETLKKPFSNGEKWTVPGICAKKICEKVNDVMITKQLQCSDDPPPKPPCRLQQDMTAKYPKCCPRVVCTGERKKPQK